MPNAKAKSKFRAAVKKAKQLYKTGRYKRFSDAVKAAYGKKTANRKKISSRRRSKATRKKVSAVKLIERGENRRTKAKRIVRVNRTRKGTFKKFSTVTGISDYNYVVLQKIQATNASLGQEMQRLERFKRTWQEMPAGTGKKLMRRSIKDQQKLINKIRADVRGFRCLIK